MNKSGYNSFSREQLDIIEKYKKKEEKLFSYIIYGIVIILFINMLLDYTIIYDFISISLCSIILINITRYYYFKITMNKKILEEIKLNR